MSTSRGRRIAATFHPVNVRALLVTLLSLAAWGVWGYRHPNPHPWQDLTRGVYTDHFSHLNAARAFARVGPRIYREGAASIGREPTLDERHAMPSDVKSGGSFTGGIYMLPGLAAEKPWVTSWSSIARPYPPGDLLLVAPVALLYEKTSISFTRANTLLIALFVLYAHVGFFVAARLVLRQASWARPVLALGALVLYFEAMHAALEGFYDVAAIAPLLLAFEYLAERRALAAVVAYCVAAFVHFRVFFLAPVAVMGGISFLLSVRSRPFTWRDGVALLTAALLACATLGTFAVLVPTLRTMEMNNPANLFEHPALHLPVLSFAVVASACAAVLAAASAWFDLVMLAWLTLCFFSLRQAMGWHALIVLPWVIAPVTHARAGASESVRAVRLAFVVYVALAILRTMLWPGDWVPRLFGP